jgi:hypothetical protein
MLGCASCSRLYLPHPLLVSVHVTASADLRPEIFDLRDLNDNKDLQRISGRLLAMVTSITPSLELIEPLMDALMSILKNAEVRPF